MTRRGLTLGKAFVEAASVLRQAGIETPELDARLLLCHAAGLSHEAYIARARDELAPEVAARLGASIERRLKREPVSRIVGAREFYGRSFLVDPHALDPRPDTESLIEAALALVERQGLARQPAQAARSRHRDRLHPHHAFGRAAAGARRRHRHQRRGARPCRGQCASALAWRLAPPFSPPIGSTRSRAEFDLILANPPYLASGEIAWLADGGCGSLTRGSRLTAAPTGSTPIGALPPALARSWPKTAGFSSRSGPRKAEAVAGILRGAGLRLDEIEGIRPDLAGQAPRGCGRGVTGPADHSVAGQKKTWKTAMFGLGSCQQTTIRPLALGSARPVATATRADIS